MIDQQSAITSQSHFQRSVISFNIIKLNTLIFQFGIRGIKLLSELFKLRFQLPIPLSKIGANLILIIFAVFLNSIIVAEIIATVNWVVSVMLSRFHLNRFKAIFATVPLGRNSSILLFAEANTVRAILLERRAVYWFINKKAFHSRNAVLTLPRNIIVTALRLFLLFTRRRSPTHHD